MVETNKVGEKLPKDSLRSLQNINSILRQKLKESGMVNVALSKEISQMRQKYQEAMDQLVDEVVRLEGMNTEAKLHFNVLWEEFQVEKLASVERRKMLTQIRRDHAEELSQIKNSMPKTPKSIRMGKDLVSVFEQTAITLQRKDSISSEHDEFEALLESALEITGCGYESPKLPSMSFSFSGEAEKDRIPRRGSFEQHQEDAVLRARGELFTQPPVELPFDVLANLLDEESVSMEGGRTKSRRLSLTEPHRLKALAGLVNSSGSLFLDLDEAKLEDRGSDEVLITASRREQLAVNGDREMNLVSARVSVEAVSNDLPADNSARRTSWVHGTRPRTSKVTIPNMESHESTEAQYLESKKEEELSQNEALVLEDRESYDDEESTSMVCLSDVAVIPSGVLHAEEKVDVMDVDVGKNCSVIYPCDLKVRQQTSDGVMAVIPLLKMDSSSIVKLLREGSSLIVNVPHTIGATKNEIFDDNASSDASDEKPFTETNMRTDVPDWIRRTCQDIPCLEISEPLMAFIMPRIVCLDLQHVLSITVKVKRSPRRLQRDHTLDARRKRSQSAVQPHYARKKARGRKKTLSQNGREPAISMKPVMRYNASARASPLYMQRYRGSNNGSLQATPPRRLKQPKTVLLVPSPSSSLGLGHSGFEYNTNHNKQKVYRRKSPLAGSTNSRSRSWQRSSDNELKLSSENQSSEVKVGRRKEKLNRVKNHKNTHQNILQEEEESKPSAVVKKKRSKGGFFSKFR